MRDKTINGNPIIDAGQKATNIKQLGKESTRRGEEPSREMGWATHRRL
jgi:hypothetical protein